LALLSPLSLPYYTTSVCIFQDVCIEKAKICIVKDTEKGVFCTEKDGGFFKKDTYISGVLERKWRFWADFALTVPMLSRLCPVVCPVHFSLYINTFFYLWDSGTEKSLYKPQNL